MANRKGGRWSQEAKARNRIRRYQQRQRDEQHNNAAPEPGTGDIQEPAAAVAIDENEEAVAVAVNVPEPSPEPEPDIPLTQRVLGKIGLVSAKGKASKKSQELNVDLAASLVPLFCLLMAGMGELFIRNPKYKPCVPKKDELEKIIRPLVNIVSRRLEIAGKMTEDTLDLLTALAMTVVMGTRMYSTFLVIRDSENGVIDASHPSSNSNITQFPQQAAQQQHQRAAASHIPSGRADHRAAGRNQSDAGNGRSIPNDGWAVLDGQSADDIISRALSTDAEYRARQGIL